MAKIPDTGGASNPSAALDSLRQLAGELIQKGFSRSAVCAEVIRANHAQRLGVERSWPEQWCDWESLRTFSRLPLFGVSYSVLILIPITLFLLSFYNDKVDLLRRWADKVEHREKRPKDGAPRGLADPARLLAGAVRERLHRQPIPSQSLLLFASTILLAVASTVYTVRCPTRIKEFSRGQWCDELRKSLLHYWPLSWRDRPARLVCWACYVVGATGALWVLACKVVRAFIYILEHLTFSLV